jgi:CMP-N-acetylneuraminic acid synthetase
VTQRATLVALLPMKAHSERVPGKNFRDFCGKPLFRWILDTLFGLEEIERIIINTDARDILLEKGFEESPRVRLRERKRELCGDLVSMNHILADDVGAVPADTYLMTHTTNPLLGAETIRSALTAYYAATMRGEADSLFSVTRFQSRFYREDGSAVNHDPAELVRTQDLEPWYEENSSLYVFSETSFRATGARIGGKPLLFETPAVEAVDIDDARSWELARRLALGAQRDTS